MTTVMSDAIKKAEEDNKKAIATYIYKYSDFSSSKAIEELMRVDLFKNNFTKATLSNYLRAVRTFVHTGEKKRFIAPLYMYKIAQELKDKHYARLTPPANCKGRMHKSPSKSSTKEVVVPVSNDLTETSKQSMSSIINAKHKLEVESATAQNSIKKLQERILEINNKIQAINVVMDLIK